MEKIPVFIFHIGNPEYLKIVVEQASKKNEVHLLGDKSNKDACSIWDEAEKYVLEDFRLFEKVFFQMSDYSLEFDLNCFKRFFIMKNYMIANNINNMVFADSDLMIYTDFTEYYATHKCHVALSIPERQDNYRWTAQAHCSFWTLDYLIDFLDYVTETYKTNNDLLKKKYNYHIENNLKGGVCDMTLLYLWSKDKSGVHNIARTMENSVFDHCLGSPDNYYDNEFSYNKLLHAKKVFFKNEIPFFKSNNGDYIEARVIHCQGSAKTLIPFLVNFKFATPKAYLLRYIEIADRLLKRMKK